jgi:hypothetical protein
VPATWVISRLGCTDSNPRTRFDLVQLNCTLRCETAHLYVTYTTKSVRVP